MEGNLSTVSTLSFQKMILSQMAAVEHNYGRQLAKPLHIQQLEAALNLEPFMKYVEAVVCENIESLDESDSSVTDVLKSSLKEHEESQVFHAMSNYERKADKTRLYNLSQVKKSRRWLRTILLSDSSSSEDDEMPLKMEDVHFMLRLQRHRRRHRARFYQDSELRQYQYLSTGLLSHYDRYPEHSLTFVGHRKKLAKEQKKQKARAKLKKLKKENNLEDDGEEIDPSILQVILAKRHEKKKSKKLTAEQADIKRRKLWVSIAKKEIPRAQKQKVSARKEMLATMKKVSTQAMRECRRTALQSQKTMKETPSRARRLTREMLIYWKRFEKVEKEHRKRAEKEALEQRKLDIELREAKRQQRKLNFLITQTELYAHFMARKITGEGSQHQESILAHLDERNKGKNSRHINAGVLEDELLDDDYDGEAMKKLALSNAETAYSKNILERKAFDADALSGAGSETDSLKSAQPDMFAGKLKGYQLKGMNWVANLYNQGINGILADEMGLGKTVQSIAFLAYLAEVQNIWGPFLIIAPASTLHNWQQEVSRFTPRFKVVPYWGNTQDRKILRKFWDSKCLHTEEASFHVVITSYQLVIQDVKYFQRIKWQYMVLDEAQAIKSTTSVRWKILLGFSCRNRLLLTGTPIQNSMAELWALLHFIMPTLFDSHDEFNEWFSKDIESHVEKQSGLDENQLSRLHMILKPFMLRRVKKDVENELSDKIEILVYCPLTSRQRSLYQAIKTKISIEDLLYTSTSSSAQSSSLMNIVMQFRKVCNHPELFERNEAKSPVHMPATTYILPKLIYREGQPEFLQHIILNKLYIFSPHHIHCDLFHSLGNKGFRCFSFSRLINLSPQELNHYMLGGLLVPWLTVSGLISQQFLWAEEKRFTPRRSLYIPPVRVLEELVFTSYTSRFYTHDTLVLHYMPETFAHRQARLRRSKHLATHSPTKAAGGLDEIYQHKYRSPRALQCVQIDLPAFFLVLLPKVTCPGAVQYSVDRSAEWSRQGAGARLMALAAPECLVKPHFGWTPVQIPDKESLVTDAGKLYVLDSLLQRLKGEDHRVLIYSQMTRMIDLLEEYMWYRKHTYMRLDGSSKISERRDMVADFQTRSDIFVFLLSTRAGGLGINLTAADTVIFYDSDWNPTVDQQAMDRAHRLGQTKQVTVYRLICKGTIEERILQRAKEKSEIQKMVISGGSYKPDTLKPREVVSLLIDDEEMEKKLLTRQFEKVGDDPNLGTIFRKRKREYKKRDGSKKKSVTEEKNVTIPAPDQDSIGDSMPASPMSFCSELTSAHMSVGSEATAQDDSNDGGLVIVDDSLHFTPVSSPVVEPPKRGRGRPRGSSVGKRGRGRGSARKAMSAAEIAGAHAGMTAAYAAYGYNLKASGQSKS
ncbi:chromatin-remodeling ATPase INO80-like isoform X2 [Physella acuta]|uniref:chromatin-remodeling ATPase INO80-like isoform X2 n=1 Tax=Physella acuta TaxID=109671 RepID=UPI0027DB6558|nr:chromatin-remodeling ATPase INO80-like isoform X2 [Physella acuta]